MLLSQRTSLKISTHKSSHDMTFQSQNVTEYAAHDITAISSKAILVMTLPSAVHLINKGVWNNLGVRREE